MALTTVITIVATSLVSLTLAPTTAAFTNANQLVYIDEPRSWQGAEDYCRNTYSAGHLVSITSADEQQIVSDIVVNHQGESTGDDNIIWLGLNDIDNEGTFVWTGGSPLTYTNWGNGEPSNGGGSGNEDCTHFHYFDHDKDTFVWNDLPCDGSGGTPRAFICQLSPDADTDGDGIPDVDDPQPLNPKACGDTNGDTCDSCALVAGPPATISYATGTALSASPNVTFYADTAPRQVEDDGLHFLSSQTVYRTLLRQEVPVTELETLTAGRRFDVIVEIDPTRTNPIDCDLYVMLSDGSQAVGVMALDQSELAWAHAADHGEYVAPSIQQPGSGRPARETYTSTPWTVRFACTVTDTSDAVAGWTFTNAGGQTFTQPAMDEHPLDGTNGLWLLLALDDPSESLIIESLKVIVTYDTSDTDSDGICDATDEDDDGDGCPDSTDPAPLAFSTDEDGDGLGSDCDDDDDHNMYCRYAFNSLQQATESTTVQGDESSNTTLLTVEMHSNKAPPGGAAAIGPPGGHADVASVDPRCVAVAGEAPKSITASDAFAVCGLELRGSNAHGTISYGTPACSSSPVFSAPLTVYVGSGAAQSGEFESTGPETFTVTANATLPATLLVCQRGFATGDYPADNHFAVQQCLDGNTVDFVVANDVVMPVLTAADMADGPSPGATAATTVKCSIQRADASSDSMPVGNERLLHVRVDGSAAPAEGDDAISHGVVASAATVTHVPTDGDAMVRMMCRYEHLMWEQTCAEAWCPDEHDEESARALRSLEQDPEIRPASGRWRRVTGSPGSWTGGVAFSEPFETRTCSGDDCDDEPTGGQVDSALSGGHNVAGIATWLVAAGMVVGGVVVGGVVVGGVFFIARRSGKIADMPRGRAADYEARDRPPPDVSFRDQGSV